MNRIAIYPALAILALIPLVGCEHHEATLQYDPSVDSVLPTYLNSLPDMTILDDQRKIHEAMAAAVRPAAAAPAAPASAPAAPAAPGSAPPPPPA